MPTAQELIAAYTGTPYTTQQITGQAPLSTPAPTPAPVNNTPSPVSDRMREFSIGLYDKSITNQSQLGPTGSFGSQFNAEGQRTSGSPSASFTANYGYPAPAPAPKPAGTTGGVNGSTPQGSLAGAGTTASGGTTSRYGLGTSGMSPEEEELTRQLETVEKPKTAEEIASERTQQAQAEINAINENYNNQLIEQGRVNDLRSAEANAQSVLSGLTGSTEAGTRAVNVAGYNAQENRKIQGERALALATLYRSIQNDARAEARQQAQDYRSNAKEALASMSARREANVAKAEKNVISLASTGVTVDGLKATDPQTYQYLADMVGGEQQLKAMFVLNRPQETIIDKKFENGKYIVAYQSPEGKIRIETLDTGLPPDVKTQVMDNNLYSSEDGGVTWKLAIAGKPDQLKQLQIEKARVELEKAINETGTNGMTATENADALETINLVNQIISDPYLEQVVGLKNPFTYWTPGSNEQMAKNRLNQLIGKLQLGERHLLKGSGAVSDFESKILRQASTAMGTNLSNEDARRALEQVQGALTTAYGGQSYVRLTNKDGESGVVLSDSNAIANAIKDGLTVEYVANPEQ